MIFLLNPPEEETLNEEYEWGGRFEKESSRSQNRGPLHAAASRLSRSIKQRIRGKGHHVKVRRILKRYVSGGKIIDVGCGAGGSLIGLGSAYIPVGIEISHELWALADSEFRKLGGYAINASGLEGLKQLESNCFDGAVMRAYLEHECQPLKVLQELSRTLKPLAPVVIKVPNHASPMRWLRKQQWSGYRFPDHVNYFTPKTLVHLIHQADLHILAQGIQFQLPLSDNMWIIAQKPGD